MSIIDPSTCGFVKIFCYRVFTNKNLIKRNPSENMNCYKSRVLHHQYNAFQSTFCESSLISYDKFRENFQHIVHNIQTLGKKYPEKKRHVIDIFSLKNWVDLKKGNSNTQYSIALVVSVMHWQCSQYEASYNKQKQRDWV